MREAIVVGERKFAIRRAPKPVLNPDEVLIRVQYCGICGSDLHTYILGLPGRYGHEYAGDIVAVGSEVEGWKPGDRVTAESVGPCDDCYWCTRGEMGLCETFYDRWGAAAGGFATYTKAKCQQLHRLPLGLTYQEAALTEPTAVALHGVRLSGMRTGDVVAVLGLGPIGQLVARLARASGAMAVYASETSKSRLKLARGAADEVIDAKAVDPVARILELTGGRGPDVVFECAGAVAPTLQAMTMTRKGGTIVIVGVSMNPAEIIVGNIALRELTIKGSMIFAPGEYGLALSLMAEKRIDVAPLITAVLPLDDINQAFAKATSGEGGKILIKP
jgi:2-desacetyl-2-hydroxyethyl bacteriochlorophyllide A dehydrogenase